jgi:pyruvate kinase
MICTKIVATMGPACNSVETLLPLLEAGVDVCRLNFSHGTLDQHLAMLKVIREAAQQFGRPIALLGDLGGPKIRLGQVADIDHTGGMPINTGDDLIVQRDTIIGQNHRVSTTYPRFVDDVEVGHRVFIEDGLLRFVCTDKSPNELVLRCTVGGILKTSKGINLPDTAVNTPSITPRDWECVDWAVANDLDYLALSFVRRAHDLNMLRGHLDYKASDIALIAKIEKGEALKQIDAIIEASDGLMVARGDLGVEMDVAQVPIIQKDLVRRCQRAGKPVIVATQMLQSMVENASPTRAEVSDVANALFDGTDAIMLSAETSVGKFPAAAVHTMSHVAEVTESYLVSSGDLTHAPHIEITTPAAALARGAYRIVQDIKAKLVVIWSETGHTALVFSKHHFPVPIVALSSDPRALRRMAIHYGVVPEHLNRPDDMADLITAVDNCVCDKQYASRGDRIVIVAGWSPAMHGTMNGIVIHTLGEKWTTLSPAGESIRPYPPEHK